MDVEVVKCRKKEVTREELDVEVVKSRKEEVTRKFKIKRRVRCRSCKVQERRSNDEIQNGEKS